MLILTEIIGFFVLISLTLFGLYSVLKWVGNKKKEEKNDRNE